MTPRIFGLNALPVWAALLPLVTITLTHMIAASAGHVPYCVAYLTGCTSVSSSGRSAPESIVFRAGMVPAAVILIVFWHRCALFLELSGVRGRGSASLKVIGVILGLSLMLYALTLGYSDSIYPAIRRAGMTGFAVGTFVAEIIFIVAYRPLQRRNTENMWRWLIVLCVALPLLDLMSEIVKWSGVNGNSPDHVATWNAFIAASVFYVIVGRIWRAHGFDAAYRVQPQ